MAKTRLSAAAFVERGYGQVEPNHLSAQRTGQIYAQLPAAAAIDVLENGQFVKYDYPAGVVDFVGDGEWMLVFNEVKVYHDHESDCDFALKKTDYNARVYSPVGPATPATAAGRNYSGTVLDAPYDPSGTTNPFLVDKFVSPQLMPTNTTMVPRVFKTNIGDIFTTNTLAFGLGTEAPTLGDKFAPDAANAGILTKVDTTAAAATASTSKVLAEASADMIWQVVKIYTLPDRQKAVKLMRIK